MKNFCIVIAGLTASSPAWAYLDPGTGSIALQALIALIAIVGVGIRTYWHKLLSLFGKKKAISSLDDECIDKRNTEE